jgi:hypothetical protein
VQRRHTFLPGFALLLLSALAPALGGCSTFGPEWRSPKLLQPPADDPFAGRWKGSWRSVTGHSGGLRCIVTKVDEDTYRARFHATYALMLEFEYTADMDVEMRDGVAWFKGQADLGKMAGGIYKYDGHADGKTFDSAYQARSDHGRFKMARPK